MIDRETALQRLHAPTSRAERAELQAILGVWAARAGDALVAEVQFNEAIALALEIGDPDTLADVARWTAETCLVLGRPGDAIEAAERGLALRDDDDLLRLRDQARAALAAGR